MTEKEHKKKRRKQEEESDSLSRKRRRKDNHPVAKEVAEYINKASHSQGHSLASLPSPLAFASDEERSGKRTKKKKQVNTSVGIGTSQDSGGGITISPQLPPPNSPNQEDHPKEKHKHAHRERGKTEEVNDQATHSTALTSLVAQDQEKLHKKKKKKKYTHEVHTDEVSKLGQQENEVAGDSRPTLHLSGNGEEPRKPEEKHETIATDLNIDAPEGQESGTAGDLRRDEPTAHENEKRKTKKETKKRKAAVTHHDAESNEPQKHPSGIVTSPQPFTSISQDQEIQHRKYKNVNGGEPQHQASEAVAGAKSNMFIPESRGILSKRNSKRKHRDTDPEAEDSDHRSIDNAFHTQESIHTEHLPKVDPGSPNGSAFYLQTSSLYLPLAPISQLHPLEGLCTEHLSPLVLTYYAPFRGVILSYHNPRLCNSPGAPADQGGDEILLARSIDEYAAPFVWVTAEFLLFKPKARMLLDGWVNLQNEGQIGMVCWNLFSASVGRNSIPTSWKWVQGGWDVRSKRAKKRIWDQSLDDEEEANAESADAENLGHFMDGVGKRIKGALTFRVKRVEVSRTWDREKGERSFVSLEGSLLSQEEERRLPEKARQKSGSGSRGGNGMRGGTGYDEYTIREGGGDAESD